MKPFLILQLRPETGASDNEYEAFLEKGGLEPSDTHRIRLDQHAIPADLDPGAYSGIIVGGGPGCVSDPPEKKSAVDQRIEDGVLGLMPAITSGDLPFLGCCYGIGILAHHLGAPVGKERYSEPVGPTTCLPGPDAAGDPLLAGLPDSFRAFVGHKEAVQELPRGCVHLLASSACPFQMIRYGRNVYATQFHPELDATGLAVRVRIYKDYGYFPPEDAEPLIRMAENAGVRFPELVLRNFVRTYARPAEEPSQVRQE